MNPAAIPLALYVHMPWCVRKCPYCDFNSHQLKSPQPDGSYIDSLLLDLQRELPGVAGRRIETIFFGGGTPSLFAPADIARLLRAFRELADVHVDAEVTLEANPGTIERGLFKGYAEAGINRVSLGVQSFDAHALRVLGRIHAVEDTYRSVEELRASGIENFNLDLMFALPGQSLELARRDIESACALQPTHISYYQLTLEPGTVFHARPPQLPDEDTAWEMQLAGEDMLERSGYAQYEVSAYAKARSQCRHNLNYWLFGDYLGIGAGAHGKLSSQVPLRILRTVKHKQPSIYQAEVRSDSPDRSTGFGERRYVAEGDRAFEFMLNALRLNEGFEEELYETRTGQAFDDIEPAVQGALQRGLMEYSSGKWRATVLGRRFLNDLQSVFLA